MPSKQTTSYEAPNSWQIDDEYEGVPGRLILIDDQAWRLFGDTWQQINIDGGKAGVTLFTLNINAYAEMNRPVRQEDGPTIDGESTTRSYSVNADYGNNIGQGIPAREDLYQDAKADIVILQGKRTNRLYQVDISFDGPNVGGHEEMIIDYDMPVSISPPR